MNKDPNSVKVLILQDHPQHEPLSLSILSLLSQHKSTSALIARSRPTSQQRKWSYQFISNGQSFTDLDSLPSDLEQQEMLLQWPDILLVSCMQADTLAKMLHGISDGPLLAVCRSWDVSKKMAVIPAMSRAMWENPMTRKQLSKIRRKWPWVRVLEPLIWDGKDGGEGAVYGGVQECVDVLKNQVDLLLLGHDHVPTAAGYGTSNELITANDKNVRLPSEIWSIILQFTSDWELAKTLGIYTNLPVPVEWQDHPFTSGENFMRDLEWTILTGKLHDIIHLFQTQGPPKSLSNLCVKLIIRFSRTDILSYLEKTHHDLFWSQFGHTLLPTKASAFFGQTAVLDWWQRSPTFLSKEYNNDAMDFASKSGFVHVLEWWHRSGLPLRYTDAALEQASSQGHIAVLDWWRGVSNYHDPPTTSQNEALFATTSASTEKAISRPEIERNDPPLRLKVGKALIYAAQNGQTAAIRWWMSSGIPTVHEDAVARTASAHGHVNVLAVWKAMKGEKMQYDHQVLVGPTKNQHVDVLEWWKRAGYRVEYKTCDIEEALEDAIGGGQAAREWWGKRGVDFKADHKEWTKLRTL
ncbi:MAG: hypothetical protein Q9168_006520 [Polycauliona sp. 1 TL-2023]